VDTFKLCDGFQTALTPANLFVCMVGILWLRLVGALPEISPTGAARNSAAVVPVRAGGCVPILLAGYYGTQYRLSFFDPDERSGRVFFGCDYF
jgi:TctA family transporter